MSVMDSCSEPSDGDASDDDEGEEGEEHQLAAHKGGKGKAKAKKRSRRSDSDSSDDGDSGSRSGEEDGEGVGEAQGGAAASGGVKPRPKKTAQIPTLQQIRWRRVVFDESQWVKDPKARGSSPLCRPTPGTSYRAASPAPAIRVSCGSGALLYISRSRFRVSVPAQVVRAQACRALVAQRRWLLSGTPVSTQVGDLRGQAGALRFDFLSEGFEPLFAEPFRRGPSSCLWSDRGRSNRVRQGVTGEGKASFPGEGALRLLLPQVLIRHTKSMVVGGERVLTLPKKTERTISVELSAEERRVYRVAEAEVRRKWRQIAERGERTVATEYLLCMSLLQPLRRCAHPQCPTSACTSLRLLSQLLRSHAVG